MNLYDWLPDSCLKRLIKPTVIRNYTRNMWFKWSVHWQDQKDERFWVVMRWYIHQLVKRYLVGFENFL